MDPKPDYDALARRQRVLVQGAAGTGKTYLMRQVCRRWSEDQGRSVLLLTATDPLSRWWERKAPRGVRVASVPRLCRELLKIEEPKRKRGDWGRHNDWDEEYWDALPRRAAEALSLSGDGWEAVVVDGATDMSDAAWKLVDACAPNMLWACVDPHRAFWPDRHVPDDLFDEVLELNQQHRPQSIHDTALRYLADDPGEDALPPEITIETERGVDDVVGKLLDEGMKPWRIAVLSLRGRGERRGAVRERPVRGAVGGSSRRFEEALVLETFLRFAGLERRVVVLTDLDLVEDRYDQRMYVALTRATERVIVCAPRQVLEHDEVLYGAIE